MPRPRNDYSAKQTVSPEVKNISAKRLFRGVGDCVHKLDVGRQHRRNLISLFQAEQVKLRHKLREACEKLMFTHPSEYCRKAEELLWKKVYYDVVRAVKSGRKFQSNAPGALQQRHLEPHYKQFLYSAIGFYHYLLLRVQSKAKSGLMDIDFPLASRPLSRSSHLLNDRHGFISPESMQESEEKELEEWVRNRSYRILVCLGDLSRYQIEFGASRSRPSRYYQLALLARPGAGMPHNQLATIAGHHYWWGLTAAYHYCRCLHAELSYEGAEGNLQNLFDRNKKLFYQLPTDALDDVITADVYKKEHTRIFIVSFLYLCDLLRPKTYATDVETTGLCKRLIDALHVCLNHMNTDPLGDLFAMEDMSSSVKSENSLTNKHKADSKRSGTRSSSGSQDKSPSSKPARHHNQHKLNGDVVFKICVMCLVNVHDLQTCRSNRSSAAIAFILAFFSHLLGYLIGRLSLPKQESKDAAGKTDVDEEGEDSSKADGDAVNGTDGNSSKSKKSRSRLRRRRRGGTNEDDLSEGEDDFMGGGDAASGSELSDSDSEDDSATLSDTSGSEARLSQEEMSSQEEEPDTNENDFFSSREASLPPKDVLNPPVIESPSPSLAVASLQDLSNKMFQPPTRRKITLAPSFLQNLTPKQDAKVDQDTSKEENSGPGGKNDGEKGRPASGSLDSPAKATEAGDARRDEVVKNGNNAVGKQSEAERMKNENEVFANLLALSRHHHVMAAVKLLSDWLAINERVAAACAKNSRALWNRLVCLLNLLPTEREMLKRDEIKNDAACSDQVNKVVQTLEKNEVERKAKSEERAKEEAKKEAVSKEKKIKIEKRKTTEESEAKKPPQWMAVTGLPEDYTVHLMKAVKESAVKTGLDLSPPYVELSDLHQCVIRTCRLRHLCRSLSAIEGVEIDAQTCDDVIGSERFTGPEEEVVDPQMELEAVEAMRKTRLMKDMAASRLRNEVQALESSLGTPKSRDSALCLYLVPDTYALCYELPHVRRLVASERFFVIITKTVIDGLDGLKKDLQGARDAIRYLETEFRKSNRFIRAQTNEELVRGVHGERPKLRRQDLDAWRFYRNIECCRFLIQQEANKTNTGVKDHNGLVTILTHEKATPGQHLTVAIETAKSYGIQTQSAATFNKSWSQNNS